MTRPALLFHVSDLHFGQEDRAALDWFAAEVTRERPDRVICTGDLTMRGSAREFAMAGEWLGSLAAPVSVQPGNHDVPYYHRPLKRLLRPYAEFRAMQAGLEQPASLPDIAVVQLKTIARAQLRLNWSKGRIATADLASTLARLTGEAGSALRLVSCHHPLIDTGTKSNGATRGGAAALTALAGAGVTAVLSGHVHDPFDQIEQTPAGPIRIIGAGTLSQRLRRTAPSFNRLEWTAESGLTVAVRQA